jgi:hypothetical protein
MPGQPLPTLRALCIAVLARCLHTVSVAEFTSFTWPEDILVELLQVTLGLGRLNEHSLRLVLSQQEEGALQQALKALNLQPLPPRVGAAGRFLGQRPHLF